MKELYTAVLTQTLKDAKLAAYRREIRNLIREDDHLSMMCAAAEIDKDKYIRLLTVTLERNT